MTKLVSIGTLKSSSNLFKTKYDQAIRKNIDRSISKTIGVIPGAKIFTSSIIKWIKGKKVNNQDIYHPINKKVVKRIRRVRIFYV